MRFLCICLAVWIGACSAATIPESARCMISVAEALSRIRFSGSPTLPYSAYICTNWHYTLSLYVAGKVYCSTSEIEQGLRVLDGGCEKLGLARVPYKEVEPELSEKYIAGLRILEVGEVNKGTPLHEPVLISKDYFERAYRTNRAWAFQTWSNRAFGNFSYWFWALVLLFGMINRVSEHFLCYRSVTQKYDQEGHYPSHRYRSHGLPLWLRRARYWLRVNLVLPPAVGDYHQRLLYWCTVPTRMEALAVVIFYILTLVFTAVGYDIFRGNLYWDRVSIQAWRYLSDRTGIMSYCNLVLLWLFGGRNNPFLWATGWSFGTFNIYHRAIARVATIQAIIHSVGYTVLAIDNGLYLSYWSSAWWYMGVAGTIAMALLLGFSSIWLRRNYYEIFLLVHIGLSIVVIVGLFIHTTIFSGAYDIYLWPVVIVWVLDRAVRLIRVAYCNIHVQRHGWKLMASQGTAYYDVKSKLIRLEITPGLGASIPQPGHFYYIYQPLMWKGYESHPFTVGSWTEIERDENVQPTGSPWLEAGRSEPRYSLVFWIRPFDGWTRRLRSKCLQSPSRTIRDTFLVEGPYGSSISLSNYENVVLIAGGAGFAGVWPHVEEHLRHSQKLDTCPEHGQGWVGPATTKTQNITLVLVSREPGFYEDLMDRERVSLLTKLGVTLEFYCTSPAKRSLASRIEPDENTRLLFPTAGETCDTSLTSLPFEIKLTRPNIKKIISESLHPNHEIYSPGDGIKDAVLVCGPGAMADETRAAVRASLANGYREIDYYEEAFNW